MNRSTLKTSSAVIVVHESEGGPGHDLKNFLLNNKIQRLLLISHPLLFFKEGFSRASRYELYENGTLVGEGKARYWKLPEPLLYIKDTIYTLKWSSAFVGKTDLFFGVGNLNAFAGLLLRLTGKAKRVIFYVIDYVPQRFQNRLLNFIYHFIEMTAARFSDWTWNLSPRMNEAREKRWNMSFVHQLTVPHGVHFDRIKRVSFAKIDKKEIIYMGTLQEKQGIQLVIASLPMVIAKIPSIKFTIIGKGPYEQELRSLVSKLHLNKHVSFLGHIESRSEMEDRIAKAAIAVALYDKKTDTFTYYSDPGKIKHYLGAGVPILLTDVPFVAKEVQQHKCGFIAQYAVESVVKILTYYFSSTLVQKKYRKNAEQFVRLYDWNRVFAKAISYV